MLTQVEQNDIKELLLTGNKIFLDKDCEQEHIRHTFYYQETTHSVFFYHVKFSYVKNKNIPILKDYPTKSFSIEEKENYLNTYLHDMINEIYYYINKGYIISCNKEE